MWERSQIVSKKEPQKAAVTTRGCGFRFERTLGALPRI